MSHATSAASDPPDVPMDSESSEVPLSRHYAADVMTVFKIEGHLFRFDRKLLDEDMNKALPLGGGSREDPIELVHIRRTDLEILLDFLKTGTRHDKKPLTVGNWASVIAVCSALGMQRVLDIAYKALTSTAGLGFEIDSYGMYFLIQKMGTTQCLNTPANSNTEGIQLKLYERENADKSTRQSMVFFIGSTGALHHAASGLAVDIIDDVPVLRRSRPVSGRPNPWSRPLPEFSVVNSQIRVKFLSDPSLPSCTDDLYPKDSWATKDFVLATHTEKDFHMHPISDFSPWIPASVAGSFGYTTDASHEKKWRVLVEESVDDVGGARTSWEIVSASQI